MLDEATRSAILRLRTQGHGSRTIARALGVSREAVRAVIRSGTTAVPSLERDERPAAFHDTIVELHARYRGHLGRVHADLLAQQAEFSYSALTAYCRRHGIGYTSKLPAGRYHFAPGEEMQHDTSPHRARIGGVVTRVQTASLVLCYSRMLFFAHFPRFTRFECKAFLAMALDYFGGAAARCMVDNTSVIVASGRGASMVPAPEMAAFGTRYGFVFAAHEVGDANRSARVEAPFARIERAFLIGNEFADWDTLNQRARQTCDDWNERLSNKLRTSRRALWAQERTALKPLPLHVPEVYQLHSRTVDAEGYVHLNRVRYSVPWQLIGRTLELRETLERVDVYHGPRRLASHRRLAGPPDTRVTDPAHRPPRGRRTAPEPSAQERDILTRMPTLAAYLPAFKRHHRRTGAALRRLQRLLHTYPNDATGTALARAADYGLFDLDRIEAMILKTVAGDFFLLPGDEDD